MKRIQKISYPQNDKEDTFETDKESVPEITPKNDAAIATLIASSQPKKNPSRKPSKPKRPKSVKKTPKKTQENEKVPNHENKEINVC